MDHDAPAPIDRARIPGLTEEQAHGAFDPIDAVDIALGILGAPVLAFTLMFATSGMTLALSRRPRRRKLLASVILVEAVIVAVVLAVVLR